MIYVSSDFDGGSISGPAAFDADSGPVRVELSPDPRGGPGQWYCFRLEGAAFLDVELLIAGLGRSAHPGAWDGAKAVCSYDRKEWFRVPGRLEGDEFVIRCEPLGNSFFCAAFEPYGYESHLDLIGEIQGSGLCSVDCVARGPDGRGVDLVTMGNQAESDFKVWVIARQRPSHAMAEWFAEGFLRRLSDWHDSMSRRLLDLATFYVAPCVCPDGAAMGLSLRNPLGADLARSWGEGAQNAPEIEGLKRAMAQRGADVALFVDGDESLPYVCLDGFAGGADRYAELFERSLRFDCPDVSGSTAQALSAAQEGARDGMDPCASALGAAAGATRGAAPGAGESGLESGLGGQWAAEKLGALALGITMPFKDNALLPDEDYGWSGQRALRLGECALNPILRALTQMDADGRRGGSPIA